MHGTWLLVASLVFVVKSEQLRHSVGGAARQLGSNIGRKGARELQYAQGSLY